MINKENMKNTHTHTHKKKWYIAKSVENKKVDETYIYKFDRERKARKREREQKNQ
jgi:hypothetical protein